jgi:hypothetical protein
MHDIPILYVLYSYNIFINKSMNDFKSILKLKMKIIKMLLSHLFNGIQVFFNFNHKVIFRQNNFLLLLMKTNKEIEKSETIHKLARDFMLRVIISFTFYEAS